MDTSHKGRGDEGPFNWYLELEKLGLIESQNPEITPDADIYSKIMAKGWRSFDELMGVEFVGLILKLAFERRLPRTMKWSINRLPARWRDAVIAAASIYKRGVDIDWGKFHLMSESIGESWLQTEIFWLTDFEGVVANGHCPRNIDFLLKSGVLEREGTLFVVDDGVFRNWDIQHFGIDFFVLEATEKNKKVDGMIGLMRCFRSKKYTRIIGIGGGIVGDMSLFAASLMGVPCDLIPTTTLSLIDSSVGGKSGINVEGIGKNQVGQFYLPSRIFCSLEWLKTLPTMHVKAGLIEGLKHALLSGQVSLWDQLMDLLTHCEGGNQNLLNELQGVVSDLGSYKTQVCRVDLAEHGLRAVLNFGHTLGHAIESLMTNRNLEHMKGDGEHCDMPHGYAVAMGMYYALLLGEKLKVESTGGTMGLGKARSDLRRLLRDLRCAADFGPCPDPLAIESMLVQDKKNVEQQMIQWVLLQDFGSPVCDDENQKWTTRVAFDRPLYLEMLQSIRS
jgi:3-dehydroquinate synthetase